MKYALLLFSIALFVSCKPSVRIEDENGTFIEYEITNVELTSSEKEAQKDSIILNNINEFLKNNQTSLVANYWFLCDTAHIETIREGYLPDHKNENIQIHIGKENVSIRPIPGAYEIAKGPYASYKLADDSLGTLHSYVIDIVMNDDFSVKDYSATLRFQQMIDGKNRVSFTKVIEKEDNYLLSDKFVNKKWW